MVELSPEVVARAVRWCADAGRMASEAQVRAALSPLAFDELLAAQALLADPPPARPLGPRALADMARGTDPREAAEREQQGRYLAEEAFERPAAAAPAPSASPARPPRRRAKPAAQVVVRRASDQRRAPAPQPTPPPLPLEDELWRAEGRAVLERLIRRHGARRGAILEDLRAGWRRADGIPMGDEGLSALLGVHGLSRPFQRRERALLLHALRAAGGVRVRAAAAAGLAPGAWAAALLRLGLAEQAEAIREERRSEIRRRATLSERARLLTADEERLADLGLLDEVVADLRERLPEHLKALRSGRHGPLAVALGKSLSLSRGAVDELGRRFGLDLGKGPPSAASPMAHRSGARPRPRGGPRPRRGPSSARRPGGRRP